MNKVEALTIYASVMIPAGLLVSLTIAIEIDILTGGRAVKWIRLKVRRFFFGWS